MRVVSGNWRGRVLKSPRGDAVRPTTDRVKEAMFSILGPDIQGSIFVDLCCGAGGLGIEALSRGAARAILVDRSRTSLELARENLALCGAVAGTFELVKAECLRWLEEWKAPDKPWFLVADPPYRLGLASAILEQTVLQAASGCMQTTIIEHESRADIQLPDDSSEKAVLSLESRRYGKSTLTILRPAHE